jgi:WXG100 family type VII secretion target
MIIAMSIFRVDSEQVLAANSNIQATISKLQSEVELLHSQLQSLEGSWQGAAATSFQELVKRWRLTANGVDQQLGEIGRALAHAATQYQEIEEANLRLFQG